MLKLYLITFVIEEIQQRISQIQRDDSLTFEESNISIGKLILHKALEINKALDVRNKSTCLIFGQNILMYLDIPQ